MLFTSLVNSYDNFVEVILCEKIIVTLKKVKEALVSYVTRKKYKFENIDGETLTIQGEDLQGWFF